MSSNRLLERHLESYEKSSRSYLSSRRKWNAWHSVIKFIEGVKIPSAGQRVWAMDFCKAILRYYDECKTREERVWWCEKTGVSRPEAKEALQKLSAVVPLGPAQYEARDTAIAARRARADKAAKKQQTLAGRGDKQRFRSDIGLRGGR